MSEDDMSAELTATRRAVSQALERARRDFTRALIGGDPHWMFLGTRLRVDRRRGIVATSAEPRDWRDDGIDDSTPGGRAFISMFLGPYRYFEAGEFPEYLAVACLDGLARSETHAALFADLAVVEPSIHPERERSIWLAVAIELAAGRPMTNIYSVLPGLRTDVAPTSPSGRHDRSQWERVEADLAARSGLADPKAVVSRQSEAAPQRSVDESRRALDAYVNEHLLSAVAALLAIDRVDDEGSVG